MGDVEKRPVETYIVEGTIHLGHRDFKHGEEFRSSEVSPEELEELRRNGYLKTPAEVLGVEDVNAKLARLAELEAQFAALKAAEAEGSGGARAVELAAETEAQIAEVKAEATRKGIKQQ